MAKQRIGWQEVLCVSLLIYSWRENVAQCWRQKGYAPPGACLYPFILDTQSQSIYSIRFLLRFTCICASLFFHQAIFAAKTRPQPFCNVQLSKRRDLLLVEMGRPHSLSIMYTVPFWNPSKLKISGYQIREKIALKTHYQLTCSTIVILVSIGRDATLHSITIRDI